MVGDEASLVRLVKGFLLALLVQVAKGSMSGHFRHVTTFCPSDRIMPYRRSLSLISPIRVVCFLLSS
jgi:hypothetical protein